MDTPADDLGRKAIAGFLTAPIHLRSYTNLAYLLLAFPLGLLYFIFLSVGLALGLGLTIVWVGLPILLLVLLASRGLTALERQLAIVLLGAQVPPMAPAPSPDPTAPRGVWRQLGDFLGNPVTWKGLGFLALKFPLGVATFVVAVFLLSLSLGLLLTPFFYTLAGPEVFGWEPETLGEALLCSLVGLVSAWLSLGLLNGLAWIWKELARVSLGSARHAAAPC